MCGSCCRFNFGVGDMLPCVRVIEWHWGNLPSALVHSKSWNNLSKSYGHFASTFWALEAHWQFWNGCWAIDKPCCVLPIILIFQAYDVEWCSSYHVAPPPMIVTPQQDWGQDLELEGLKFAQLWFWATWTMNIPSPTFSFMKSKFWNYLTMHLDLIVWTYT